MEGDKSKRIQIIIFIIETGQELDVELPLSTTANDIIKTLRESDYLEKRESRYKILLKYRSEGMFSTESLWDANVSEGDRLVISTVPELTPELRNSSNKQRLVAILKLMDSQKDIHVIVSKYASLKQIIDEIIRWNLYPDDSSHEYDFNILLSSTCEKLKAHESVFYSKVKEGDVLLVFPVNKNSIRGGKIISLRIRILLESQTYNLEIPDTATVGEVIYELIISSAFGNDIYVHKIINTRNGQELTYWNSLNDAHLENGDTLIITPNIPDEVLIAGLLSIENYVRKLSGKTTYDEPQTLNECKLIFIGDGAVGKTSLVNKVVRDEFNENEPKTDGIDIVKWKYNNEIDLNIWDFGGQEIYQATHKFFMTKRAIYVLVINPRANNHNYGERDIYDWLSLISSFGGDSAIIVAINKCDVYKMAIPKGALKDDFPQIIDFVETSCKDGSGINELRKSIGRAIRKIDHINELFPSSYLNIKKELENTNINYLYFNDYASLCRRLDPELSNDQIKYLIKLLNDLGVMLNIEENRKLSDTKVLNPEWITKGVYSIIHSPLLIENKGVITESEIAYILDKKLYPTVKERGYIMDMMAHFELSYQLQDRKDCYFIPGAFPIEKPANLEWNYKECLHFQLWYDVFPRSIIERFLVKMHWNIYSDYWRNGAVLKEGSTFALIEAIPFKKRIIIKVAGDIGRRELLTIIRREFKRIHTAFPNICINSYIMIDGKEEYKVNYNDLLIFEEEGLKTYFHTGTRLKYKVKELLNGIEERIDLEELKELVSQNKVEFVLRELVVIFSNNGKIPLILKQLESITTSQMDEGFAFDENWKKKIEIIKMETLELIDDLQKEFGRYHPIVRGKNNQSDA